jgi:ATP-binding cassette subfamily F protein 3
VLDAMLAAASVTPGAARSYLARFLFRGDEVEKPVSELSGGERSRLELALLGVGSVNLLLLDEPTNHLDIPGREALETFLRESPATLLLVSHVRRLLESVCDRLWVVAPRGDAGPALVAPFDGGYRVWREAVAAGWSADGELARRSSATGPNARASGVPAAATATQRSAAAATNGRPVAERLTERGGLPPLSKDAYRRERERIEGDLASLGERKAALERGLEDPVVQANFVELRRLGTELADIDAALSLAEDAWLTLSERSPR